jgi:malate dehydrogenase (oxaloacetate-decarboxylating)/malate dehydrogenase (oxaloacetate-decarboxylating)(NADP+)
MLRYKICKDEDGENVYEVDTDGIELLHNPILNKGSGFSEEERRLFKVDGLLPSAVQTLEQQVTRTYEAFEVKNSDIERYIFLRALQDRNETLFYALLTEHLEEMIPVVYTPTVGLAVQRFSHIIRSTRGIFLSPYNIDQIDAIFQSLPYRNVEMIVVTDSEGILGIGDQGIGGMGIPVGKLSLYTAGSGINPAHCLPVTLDVGTNNEELLSDPLYLGIRKRRLRGDDYFNFIDRFVEGVKRNFPNTVLQWEDFSKQNAASILDKYREALPSFNDDIQGTGAVTLAGIQGALAIKGEELTGQVFAIYGAGAGGIGVTKQIFTALVEEGLTEEKAKERIFLLDSRGVIYEGREGVDEYKKPFARDTVFAKGWDLNSGEGVSLEELINNVGITVLLGLSGSPGSFTAEMVGKMIEYTPRPIIFPLSNPTSKTEAKPEEIYRWTKGQAIVATGSPFGNVSYKGKVFVIGQGNNVFIFPGVGLGALAVKARVLTDEMFTAAARRLAELVSGERLGLMCVYPAISDLRYVCKEVAIKVAAKAMEQGVAEAPILPEALEEAVCSRMWEPRYARFTRSAEHL